MIKAILSGCCGTMGRVITEITENEPDIEIVAGVDKFICDGFPFPVYNSFDEIREECDVLIDFSHPTILKSLIDYAILKNIPTVIATTGYNDKEISFIKSASEKIPVFFTFNMSLGINLLCELSKKAAQILGDGFDVEIIEKHHNQKIDAPSGTAIMLANGINKIHDDSMQYEYDRHSKRQKRPKNEIGIHSVRGGTFVGEHEVIFAGNDEFISLKHTATSKKVFGAGTLTAVRFLSKQKAGLYNMGDILKD